MKPFLRLALLCIGFGVGSPVAVAQNALTDEGMFVSVPNPITSEAVTRIKKRVEDARGNAARPIRKVVFDFTANGKEAATTDYGTCYDLANYISQLHDLATIGYGAGRVAGHTVLPLLACKELVLSKAATVGDIMPTGEAIKPSMEAAYTEIVGKERAPVFAVVRKMYDPGVSLGKGQKNGLDYYVDLRTPAVWKKDGITVSDTTPLPGGSPNTKGIFPTDRLKTIGLVAATAETRRDVAELYGLSPSSLREDPLNGRSPLAFHLTLEGQVNGGVRESVVRTLDDVIRQKGNVLVLELRCSGGDISAARDLADDLIKYQSGDDGILIVGFVPNDAPNTAAILALACTEIVMSKKKDTAGGEGEAVLGDFESVLADPTMTDLLRKNLLDLANKQGHPAVLIEGMLDRDLVILRASEKTDKTKRRRLFREAEFETVKAKWQSDGVIKSKGQLLKLTAGLATELGLVRYTVDKPDVKEVYALYGIETGNVKEATPGWLDRFAAYLRLPTVTVLLVVIGFVGLILELKVPGVTVPGIIAALCFILVFWAHSQYSGQTAILGGLVFLLGLVLVLLEVFVIPGFGVTGLLGVVFMIGGIGLATFDKFPETASEWGRLGGRLGLYTGALAVAGMLAIFIARYLPNIPYANRLVLQPPSDDPTTEGQAVLPGVAQAVALLGAIGTAATPLRPAGMAQFGDQYVDVVTDGGYIATGVRIQVIEVEGTRIVVKDV